MFRPCPDKIELMQKFSLIIAAYIVAMLVAFWIYHDTNGPTFWRILYADIAATLVIFIASYIFKNSSFYDAYWSVAPIIIAVALITTGSDGNLIRELLVLGLICLWGIRLTWNWGYGWDGIHHEDWRYLQLQEQTGKFYWPVSLLGIHLFPTVIVFLGCIPVFSVFSNPAPLTIVDGLAFLVTASAILLETKADQELHQFRQSRASRDEILKTGVWSWCRHPNYLGEIGFWMGLFLFGYATLGGATDLMKAGPISMVLLFLIVSIPMIDKKLTASKPGYGAHKASSFALLPFSQFKS